MNSTRRTWLIIGSAILLIGIIIALTCEIKQVPDVKWKQTYDLDDKEPYGYWIYSQLVETYYADAKVIQADSTLDLTSYDTTDQVLYVRIGRSISADTAYMNELLALSESGHDILLIGEYLQGELDSVILAHDYHIYTWQDTVQQVIWVGDETRSTVDTLIYRHYSEDFERTKNHDYRYFDSWYDDSLAVQPDWLAVDKDSSMIYGRFQLDEGQIHLHVVPQLMTNTALRQMDMLAHFYDVHSHFDPAVIILDDRQDRNSRTITGEETPMDYVLAQPSLRWAYYLIILTLLLYAILRGRRRQRVIPVLERYDNTSLEHVQMVARLYGSQGQHVKLIRHMRELFYHKMEQRYYIKSSTPDYVDKLSQKSKVPKSEIEILMTRFDRVEAARQLNAYDLNVFYKSLQRFYDKCS